MRKRRMTSILYVQVITLTGIIACAVVDPPENIEVRPELLSLQCTEIDYNPQGIDSIESDANEFIEFKNTADATISLADVAFSDGVQYEFPADAKLEPGGFIVLASNSASFEARNGFAPFGVYTGKLSNKGELISLKDIKAQKNFLSFAYNDKNPWPEAADGNGRTLVPLSYNQSGDPNVASYWRASFRVNGSPGSDDPNIVLVNEVLTHTDLPQRDAVELYNPNGESVDIGNWFITDYIRDPMMFRIPEGTTIPANGYRVFDETQFNADPTSPASFRFSEHGEDVYLFSDSTGTRSGSYYHGFAFGEIENGVSFGRHVTSTGEEHFVAQKSVSLGDANAGPLVGPIVITEIMYNPADSISEFIEVKNISGEEVPLYDTKFPDNTWKVDGVGFVFPKNSALQAGEIALLASTAITEAAFRSNYNVPSDAQIFSLTQALGNKGDSLILLKPEDPYIDSANGMVTVVPYMTREVITFSDGGAWPSGADGKGSSLQRKDPTQYGNDPENWKSAAPTAGK